MTQPCEQKEEIGRIKEFIEGTRSVRNVLIGSIITLTIAIIFQVGAFLFMYGSLDSTVKKNTDYLWNDITSATRENTRNLDKLMVKLDSIKLIAVMGDPGIQGMQGIQGLRGIQGKKGDKGE
jgi:hypothetical protein